MTSPSQRIVAEANAGLTVQDGLGRTIEFKHPTALDRLRLFRAVGSLADNNRYLGMAMLAVSVTAVDGIPMPFPTSEAGIEAAIHRLGDAGIDAIGEVLNPANTSAEQNPGN